MVRKTDKNPQVNLFQPLIKDFIDNNHELIHLSHEIDWDTVQEEFSEYYKDFGRPSVPLRRMIGLILLKYLNNLSDEVVVSRWKENPYWQYFCGEIHFQTAPPIEPSEFVHFRKRIGEKGCERLLKLSIKLFGKAAAEKEVLIDTTVQEKNITFPTDTKLHKKIIDQCHKIAKKEGISQRQTYKRTVKQLMIDQRFRSHPKRKKKAKAAARKIKTIAGRLVRELERKLSEQQRAHYQDKLDIFNKILAQHKNSKNKIYSIHEPQVKCIAKGKEAKPYEFGNKSSIVKTKTSGIIVGAKAFKENVYDGDTLEPQLAQVEYLVGKRPKFGIADRGFRGIKQVLDTIIIIPKPLSGKTNKYQKQKIRKHFRARAGIEPVIGHLKHDHNMLRNYLKGTVGDSMNTILAATAFNLKKRLNQIQREIKNIFKNIYWYFSTGKSIFLTVWNESTF